MARIAEISNDVHKARSEALEAARSQIDKQFGKGSLMKLVNLRELYPDTYEDDVYVKVCDEVYETICVFERQESTSARQRHRRETQYMSSEKSKPSKAARQRRRPVFRSRSQALSTSWGKTLPRQGRKSIWRISPATWRHTPTHV